METSTVILITGASSGIGWATAKMAGQRGYSLILSGRRSDRLQQLQDEIRKDGGVAFFYPAELNDWKQIQALVNASEARYGHIDVLINNAGFGRLRWLVELDPETDIAAQIQVNLTASIQLTRAVLPGMIRRGKGHIINIASIAGLIGTPTYSVYAASKFGMRGFSEALRREVAIFGIKVSTVYPGGVATEFGQHAGIRSVKVKTPKWMQLSAEQVAKAILVLIRHPRRQVILPGYMAYVVWINQVFPGFADFILQRFFAESERKYIKNF